jgi:hypothetical protein
VAWFLSRLVVGAAWGPARDPFTFSPSLWTRTDSHAYISIAVRGTRLGRCGTPGFPENAVKRFAHLHWCGTAGWLPGYPGIIRVVSWTGIALLDAALIISWLALAVAMFLVWLGWLRGLPARRTLVVLLLFGIFPGSVYNFALFPTSVALACVVGSILAATRERFFTAVLLMIVAGLCYSSAWFAAGGLTLGLIVVALPLGPAVIVRRTLWGLAGLGSLLVLACYDQLAVGHLNAYFLYQNQGGQGLSGQGFLALVFKQNTIVQKLMGRFSAAILALRAITALSLSGAATIVTGGAWRRKESDAAQIYPALVSITVTVTLVLLSNAGAWTRSIVLAAPCVVCFRRAPLPLLCALVVVVGVTAALIARPFFLGT